MSISCWSAIWRWWPGTASCRLSAGTSQSGPLVEPRGVDIIGAGDAALGRALVVIGRGRALGGLGRDFADGVGEPRQRAETGGAAGRRSSLLTRAVSRISCSGVGRHNSAGWCAAPGYRPRGSAKPASRATRSISARIRRDLAQADVVDLPRRQVGRGLLRGPGRRNSRRRRGWARDAVRCARNAADIRACRNRDGC